MKIALGSDHTGVAARKSIAELLDRLGIEYKDFGTPTEESMDYPDVAWPVAKAVADGAFDFGILLCGTGIGMSIAANKVTGVRAALCHNQVTTEMARRHNNANVLCLGARVLTVEQALQLVRIWLQNQPEGGRHERRVGKITHIEQQNLARQRT